MKKDDTTVIYTAEDFEVFKTREPPRKREEIYIPVVEYSLDGEFLHSFVKADEAAKFHNMSNSAIRNICIGKYLYSKKTNSIFLNRGDDIQIGKEYFKTRTAAKNYIESRLRNKDPKKVWRDYHKGDKTSYCYYHTGVEWQHENSGEMMSEYYQYILKKAKLK